MGLGQDFLRLLEGPPTTETKVIENNAQEFKTEGIGDDFLALLKRKAPEYIEEEKYNDGTQDNDSIPIQKNLSDPKTDFLEGEESPVYKVLGIFGIQSPQDMYKREQEIEKSFDGKDVSKLRKEATKFLLPLAEQSVDVSLNFIGGGVLKSALKVGGILGAKKLMSSLATDEEDVLSEAGKEAGYATAIDASMGGAFKGANLLSKAPIIKPGIEKGKKFIRAQKIIKSLEDKMGSLSEKTKNAVVNFNDKINKLEAKKIDVGSAQKYENMVNNQSLDTAVDAFDNDVDRALTEMINPVSKSIKNVQNSFSPKYKEILETDVGRTPIDITDEIDMVTDALNIKATGGRQKLEKLSNILKPFSIRKNIVGGDSISDATKAIDIIKTKSPEGLELKDVHWLKQALNDYASPLFNNSSTQGLGNAIVNISRSLDNKIENIAPTYKTLNTEYRKFRNVSDELDRAFGKPLKRAEGPDVRLNLKRTTKAIENAVKLGKGLDDRLIKDQELSIGALNSTIKMLGDSGFVSDANKIKNSIDSIYGAYMGKQQKILVDELKKSSSLFKDEKFKTELLDLSEKIKAIQQERRVLKNKAFKRSLDLTKRGEKAGKIFDDLSLLKDYNLQKIESLGAGIGASSPMARKFVSSVGFINEAWRLGLIGAAKADDLLKRVDVAASMLHKNIRGPFNIYASKVRDSLKEEEQEE